MSALRADDVGLYAFVLRRMQLAESLQVRVAVYFTLFCGVGFALFLPFRCITSLLAPTLFGYHGRTYVQTYLVTYMLAGARRAARARNCRASVCLSHVHDSKPAPTVRLPRSTQPCIPPGSLNRVPASAGGKGGNVTSAGWQVTLCDPMWHVSSRSGVATLRTAIHLLLTYLRRLLRANCGQCGYVAE